MGGRRRVRPIQLRPLQLEHLWLRAETICRSIRSARHRRATWQDFAAGWTDADTDAAARAETDQEAVAARASAWPATVALRVLPRLGSPAGASLSQIGPAPLVSVRLA